MVVSNCLSVSHHDAALIALPCSMKCTNRILFWPQSIVSIIYQLILPRYFFFFHNEDGCVPSMLEYLYFQRVVVSPCLIIFIEFRVPISILLEKWQRKAIHLAFWFLDSAWVRHYPQTLWKFNWQINHVTVPCVIQLGIFQFTCHDSSIQQYGWCSTCFILWSACVCWFATSVLICCYNSAGLKICLLICSCDDL